jgi:hypothetical protein
MSIMSEREREQDHVPSPSVIIAVPCRDEARYTAFWTEIITLDVPMGSIIQSARGKSPARNRNDLIRKAQAIGATWIYFSDDDMFPQTRDLVKRLIAHDKDIVGAVYAMGHAKDGVVWPCVFDHQKENGEARLMALTAEHVGLRKVAAIGSGALLCRVAIFDTPGFDDMWFTIGQLSPEEWGDDLDFCRKARRAGLDIWCDFDTVVGHACAFVLVPERSPEGEWRIRMKFHDHDLTDVQQRREGIGDADTTK